MKRLFVLLSFLSMVFGGSWQVFMPYESVVKLPVMVGFLKNITTTSGLKVWQVEPGYVYLKTYPDSNSFESTSFCIELGDKNECYAIKVFLHNKGNKLLPVILDDMNSNMYLINNDDAEHTVEIVDSNFNGYGIFYLEPKGKIKVSLPSGRYCLKVEPNILVCWFSVEDSNVNEENYTFYEDVNLPEFRYLIYTCNNDPEIKVEPDYFYIGEKIKLQVYFNTNCAEKYKLRVYEGDKLVYLVEGTTIGEKDIEIELEPYNSLFVVYSLGDEEGIKVVEAKDSIKYYKKYSGCYVKNVGREEAYVKGVGWLDPWESKNIDCSLTLGYVPGVGYELVPLREGKNEAIKEEPLVVKVLNKDYEETSGDFLLVLFVNREGDVEVDIDGEKHLEHVKPGKNYIKYKLSLGKHIVTVASSSILVNVTATKEKKVFSSPKVSCKLEGNYVSCKGKITNLSSRGYEVILSYGSKKKKFYVKPHSEEILVFSAPYSNENYVTLICNNSKKRLSVEGIEKAEATIPQSVGLFSLGEGNVRSFLLLLIGVLIIGIGIVTLVAKDEKKSFVLVFE